MRLANKPLEEAGMKKLILLRLTAILFSLVASSAAYADCDQLGVTSEKVLS